jgi:hypothetical protein
LKCKKNILDDLKCKKRRIELVFLGPKLGYNRAISLLAQSSLIAKKLQTVSLLAKFWRISSAVTGFHTIFTQNPIFQIPQLPNQVPESVYGSKEVQYT